MPQAESRVAEAHQKKELYYEQELRFKEEVVSLEAEVCVYLFFRRETPI